MEKLKVGILGTGNIGCDLLVKIQRSKYIECSAFMGRNLESKGMQFANKMGIYITDKSINALIDNPNLCDIVFDATTATAHLKNAPILKNMGKFAIDLTPSLVGKMCVPIVNELDCIKEPNINMITCGGQATVPIINAISKVVRNIDYIEIAAVISSSSAGLGTRANIDEFTQTTKMAIEEFSGVKNAKAIIILNPSEPPIMMHNTIYVQANNVNMDEVTKAVKITESKMQQYIKGYKVINEPVYQNGMIIVMVQVEGNGDYLPKYSGNLDIITSSAVKVAEMYAQGVKNAK